MILINNSPYCNNHNSNNSSISRQYTLTHYCRTISLSSRNSSNANPLNCNCSISHSRIIIMCVHTHLFTYTCSASRLHQQQRLSFLTGALLLLSSTADL